jgi:hypothetical protein
MATDATDEQRMGGVSSSQDIGHDISHSSPSKDPQAARARAQRKRLSREAERMQQDALLGDYTPLKQQETKSGNTVDDIQQTRQSDHGQTGGDTTTSNNSGFGKKLMQKIGLKK